LTKGSSSGRSPMPDEKATPEAFDTVKSILALVKQYQK
jgi:hypothetical protein